MLVRGVGLDRDAGRLEAGAALGLGPGFAVSAAYYGQISSRWQDQTLKLTASYRF